MKNLVDPGGLMFLAVPVGKDALVWNDCRVYGAVRLPMLLEGWELVDTFGFDEQLFEVPFAAQPIFVLQNSGKPADSAAASD